MDDYVFNIEISYSMHLLKIREQWTCNYNGNSETNICQHLNRLNIKLRLICVCGNDGRGVPFSITIRWKIPEMRNEILLTHRKFITNDRCNMICTFNLIYCGSAQPGLAPLETFRRSFHFIHIFLFCCCCFCSQQMS